MNSQIVEKVRKLLALSQSSNLNEATSASAIAHKYIIQYRINEAQIAEHQSFSSNEELLDDPEPIYVSARTTTWKIRLVVALAKHYGCALWNDKQYGSRHQERSVSRYRLVGRHDDVKLVKCMFAHLLKEIQRLANAECRGQGHAFAASYCLGAVKGIEELWRKGREEALTLASQTEHHKAIQKLDARQMEAQNYLFQKYQLVIPAHEKNRMNPEAYNRGVKVGNDIISRN